MDTGTLGAATISISGAFFTVASIWIPIGIVSDVHSGRAPAPASRAHLVTSAVITMAGLVTHVLGFFSEAFVLLYAGSASLLVGAVVARGAGSSTRTTAVPPVLVAIGVSALTIGLLL